MNRNVLIAVGCGVVSAMAHFLYLRDAERRATGGEPVPVAVLTVDQKAGVSLKKEHVGVRRIPAAWVDERHVRADRIDEVLDLPLAVAATAGQVLLWTDFEERKDAQGVDVAGRLEPGQRAMTIPVTAASSVAGLLRPGHRVDIIGTFERGGESGRQSLVVLQNLTVIAVDDHLGDEGLDRTRFSTVTLSVGIEEAEVLAFAMGEGELSVALRGDQDLRAVDNVPAVGASAIFEAEQRNRIQMRRDRGIERLQVRQ